MALVRNAEPVPCPKVITPTADDLEKIIIYIGNVYGWEYIKPIEEILGAFPLSHTWDGISLDIPELEWEGKIQCIIEEFKLYPLVKIAEGVAKLFPIPLEFPVPPFGITVNVVKLIEDPDYKASLLVEFQNASEEVLDMFLPDFVLENWDGTDGVDAPAIKISKAWKEFIAEVKKILTGNIFFGIDKAVSKSPLKEIIEAIELAGGKPAEVLVIFLKLPLICVNGGQFDFDTDKFLMALKKQFKEEGKDFVEEILKYPLPLVSEVPPVLGLGDVLPKTLGDLINLDEIGEPKKIEFPNWNIDKLRDRLDNFMKNLPQIMLEACLSILTEIMDAILPLPIPIPFDLCTFLSLLGFPKEISVANLPSPAT